MRIGFSGAQGVGKTTLLNALKLDDSFSNYMFCDEVTRRVKSYGLPINEQGTDITQRLIMQEHITNVFLYDSMVTDRTALDGLVYTRYLYGAGKVNSDTLDFAKKVFSRLINKYDYLFYINPEFELVNDGIRSPDESFRDKIALLFNEAINSAEYKVWTISGDVQSRIDQVKNIMFSNQEY